MQLKLASAEKNKKTKLVTAVTTKSILHSCLVQYYLTINQSNVKIKCFLMWLETLENALKPFTSISHRENFEPKKSKCPNWTATLDLDGGLKNCPCYLLHAIHPSLQKTGERI